MHNHCLRWVLLHVQEYTSFTVGIKSPLPPPKPTKYVCREELMDEIVTKLFKCTPNPDEYGPSLIITGPGGFGKTTIATALCHHS